MNSNRVDAVVGAQIREIRLQTSLELPELAKRLNVSVETIMAWEAGEIRPAPQDIFAYANALGVKPSAFFGKLHEAFPPNMQPDDRYLETLRELEEREYLRGST